MAHFLATPVIIPPPYPEGAAVEQLKSLISNAVVPDKAQSAFPVPEGSDPFDSLNVNIDMSLRDERVNRQAKHVYDTDVTTLRTTLSQFDIMMSRVYIAPEQDRTKDEPFYVELRPSDIIIPICHQGFNRSQIMRIALISIFLKMNWNGRDHVLAPHGATSGCDPFDAYENLNDGNYFGYLHDSGEIFEQNYTPETDTDPQSGPLHRSFYRTFGVRKCPRQGEEDVVLHRSNLNNAEDIYQMEISRRTMRNRMSTIFRSLLLRASDNSRVIFVCFCRAFPILLNRILEVCTGVTDMRNVYVIGLPYADDTNTALRIMPRDIPDPDNYLDNAHVRSLVEYASLFLTRPSMKQDNHSLQTGLTSSTSSTSATIEEMEAAVAAAAEAAAVAAAAEAAAVSQSTNLRTSTDSSFPTPLLANLSEVTPTTTTPTLDSVLIQQQQQPTDNISTPMDLEIVAETVIDMPDTVNITTSTSDTTTDAPNSIVG